MKCLVTLLFCLFLFVEAPAQEAPRAYAPELFAGFKSGAVCGFSPDGATIYFVREDTVTKRLTLYEARRLNALWVDTQKLPFSGTYNDQGARLTPDGKRMYFTSDRPGGSNRPQDVWNIWYADRTSTGWSAAAPLSAINNGGDECCALPWKNKLLFSADRGPHERWQVKAWQAETAIERAADSLNLPTTWQWPSYLSANGSLLLLNSMGRGNRSLQDDIFVASVMGNRFGQPVRLPYPVNTNAYEDGAVLSPDERWLIFCRHERPDSPVDVLCVPWQPIAGALRPARSGR
jgi:hypothetical protein